MRYDLVIKRTLRDAQGILRANLPPARNLSDDQAVKSLRAIVRTPQVRQALEHGNDTALCFVLRAVNRIYRTTISRIALQSIGYGTFWTNLNLIAPWVLDRALGIKQNSG
jgi:hypothetical protein